jgi:type VI protein secretion system component VasF
VRRLAARLPEGGDGPESIDPAQDHHPTAARVGAWLPAWLVLGLACAAALLALRWTALQVSLADAVAPVQGVERRLPGG